MRGFFSKLILGVEFRRVVLGGSGGGMVLVIVIFRSYWKNIRKVDIEIC